MSDSEQKPDAAHDAPDDRDVEADAPEVYSVGYGKPPIDKRFQKGRSGNPRGRPKRARPNTNDHFGRRLTRGYLFEEAYRVIEIRENGKVIRLPAIQAAIRANLIKAAMGSRLHMKIVLDLVATVEGEDHEQKHKFFEKSLDGKLWWKQQCEDAARRGKPPPKPPVPHPDDIELDFNTCSAAVKGPLSEEEKHSWDELMLGRATCASALSNFAEDHGPGPFDEETEISLAKFRDVVERIDDVIPERYRLRWEAEMAAKRAAKQTDPDGV